jgi:hypothetical protein
VLDQHISLLVAIILLTTSSSDDFLQNEDRKNRDLHPAVFVGITGNTVRVVAMSTSFETQTLPSHLRGDVSYFLPGATGTMKDFLTRKDSLFNLW